MVVTRKASGVTPDGSPSRSSPAASSTSTKKKSGAPAGGGATGSPTATPNATISRAKGKDTKEAREFVDPPKIIGSSPLRQTSSKVTVSSSPSPKKSKKSTALQKRAPKASSGLFKSVRYAAMVGLVTYTVVICPHDQGNELAVCRTKHDAEAFWNRHIYEPHLQPRLKDLYSHPSVARVVEPVLQRTAPITKQIHSFVDQRTERLYSLYTQYTTLAGKEIHHHSRPYVAELQKHYDAHLDPYVSQYITPTYETHVIPNLAKLEAWGKETGAQMEPYLWHAAATLHHGMRELEPYLLVLWNHAADVPGVVRQRAWEPLLDLRRTYVDPQVSKMMETVDEVGGDAKVSADAPITAPEAEAEAEPEPEAPTVHEAVEEAEPTPLETVVSEEPEPVTPTPPPASVILDADTDFEAELFGNEEIVEGAEATPLETVAAEPPSATPPPVSMIPDEVEVEVTLTSAAVESEAPTSPEDEDLAAFLRDLDLDTGAAQAEAEPEPEVPEPVETETSEQAAERRRIRDEEAAVKRENIMARHADWERQVQELYDAGLAAFPAFLGQLRAQEVAELANVKHAEAMTKDADKALRNMEAFVRKLVSEGDGKTTTQEKVALLENIVGKVKKRFDDGTNVMSGQVVTWLENTKKKESDEIERLVTGVRDLGTTAQGDLGLDYAWLHDVTVKDWTRYHALLNAAKDLQTKLTDLASGSDPNAPRNALSEALRDLQLELETVVLRFRSDLNAVHQSGLEAIRGGHPGGASTSTHHKTETAVSGEPVMSILPIYDGAAVQDAQYVVLQRSKEQVEDSLKMAEEARVQHEEL